MEHIEKGLDHTKFAAEYIKLSFRLYKTDIN